MGSLLRSLVLAAPLLLGACAGRGAPALTATDVPARWDAPITAGATPWPDSAWWTAFGSPELDELIARAKANNLDIAAAAARLVQAQGQYKSTSSSLFPSLDLNGGASTRDSFTNDAPRSSSDNNSFELSAGASYELDFWGKNRNDAAAARRAVDASRFDQETVALTVTANVASTYFQVLSLRDRIAIAIANLDNQERVLGVIEAKAKAGVATPLALAQQRSTVARQRATIPPLEQQEREARASLALLLGIPPQGFDVAATGLKSVASPAVAPGLPSELLARRPDIASAEASLEGADASVASARAAFYPSISLTGSSGFSSSALAALINPAAAAYNAGASLAQPLFDGRRLSGQLQTAKGRQGELLATYRGTVFTAFSEVSNTLGSIDTLARQGSLQSEDVSQSQTAFDIAEARYRAGLEDYISVLDTQRTLYSAQDSQAQTKLSRLQSLVTLYRVLGGGWEKTAP